MKRKWIDLDSPETNVEPNENYLSSVEPVRFLNEKEEKKIQISNEEHRSSSLTNDEQPIDHQIKFMKEQIHQLQQESQTISDEMKFIKDLLTIETNARIEAQVVI